MNISLARLLLVIGIGAAEAIAAPIDYTITFTTEFPGELAPDSGGFTYDSTAALGNQFSNFLVQWDGLTFDLTAAANAGPGSEPPFCATSSDSSASFTMLTTGVCTPTNFFEWEVFSGPAPLVEKMEFIDTRDSGHFFGVAFESFTVTGSPTILNTSAAGSWSVTPASTVPEPSTIFLTFTGGAILMAGKHKRYRTLTANQSQNVTH